MPMSLSGDDMPSIEDVILKVNPKLNVTLATKISSAIYKYSNANHLNPRLVAAIIAQESRFNIKARGGLGEVGLMQLRPEFHALSVSEHKRIKYLEGVDNNIYWGTKYLGGLKTVFEAKYHKNSWIELYNRGPGSKPKKFPYARRVLSFYRQFGGTT